MGYSVSYVYKITDRYSGALAKIRKNTDKFRSSAKKAQLATKNFSNKMLSARNAINTAAIGIATAFPIKKAMDFQFAMADVQKVVNEIKTPAQLTAMRKEIFKTANEMGRMPIAIAELTAAAGKGGVKLKDMAKFMRLTTKAAIAFDVEEGTISEHMAKIATRLEIPIVKMGSMMDSINYLADNTIAKSGQMVNIIGRVSGEMAKTKMPEHLVAGWAAFADQIEVSPEIAARGLRMMMKKMSLLRGLQRKFLDDPNKAMREYLEKLAKMPVIARTKKIKKLFGMIGAGEFVTKAVTKLKLLEKTMELIADKTNYVGSMQRELNIKMETAMFKWMKVRSKMYTTAMTIGYAVLPAMTKLGDLLFKIGNKIEKFAELNPALSKTLIYSGLAATAFGGLIITLGILSGSISAIIGGFGALIGILPKITALFATTTIVTSSLGPAFGAIKIGFFAKALAFLLSPAVLITAAIALFVGGLAYLAIKSEKVRTALKGLWNAVKIIFKPFEALFDLFKPALSVLAEIASSFDFIGFAASAVSTLIDGLTVAIEFLLIPFKALAGLIKGIGSIGGAVFKGITGKKGIFNELGELGFGGERATPKKSITGREAWEAKIKEILARKTKRLSGIAAENAKTTSTLNGKIGIDVTGPGKVTRSEMATSIPGNLGFNMAGG
jgi:TP901 family phage tail tape measure protein